jgi:prepilin-type N-terminal cleavage/methylation domain-containing protein
MQLVASKRAEADSGFTLIEVLVAMMVFTITALGVAQLFAVAVRASSVARHQTSTSTLAAQKMEQLRGLTWGFDTLNQGLPVSDTTSNLGTEPVSNNGGGLNPSPPNSLEANTPGYVDYLDATGAWVGTGGVVPPAAVFIRRWKIEPLPTNPNNTLLLQVLVTPVIRDRGFIPPFGSSRSRLVSDALIVSVKTRKSR